ncbi:hypothetical protein OH491_04125 [Termitidicoccus mucosus]
MAYKVTVTSEGREAFAVADKAQPSDVIEYRATYANASEHALTAVSPEIPIPVGLTWIAGGDPAGTAPAPTPPGPVAASLDGKTFAALPLLDDGGRPIAAALVRALRWSIPVIKPGETVTISVRATVNRTSANAETSAR